MYENFKRVQCDPHAPYKPGFHGVFEQFIEIAGKRRRMLAYAPADIRESTAGVIVLSENGKSADDLLQSSGWRELADQEECKEKLIVFFLEPERGVWNTAEPYGKPDGDVAYIDAAAQQAVTRFLFCVHESKLYITGCKAGGVMANMAAAYNPAHYAGVCSVGGSGVAGAYLKAAGADYCMNLDGFEDPLHEMNIRKGEIPMPAWIIDDPAAETETGSEILDYWKRACGTQEAPRQTAPDQFEYCRAAETPYPLNQEKAAYRVCHSSIKGAAENGGKRLLRRIWKDFLYRQRRWMSSPGGDLRVTRDPVRDLDMEYHYEEFDGWMREWYVYIPQKVKDNPRKKVPLVFAMHGYTCSGEIYAGNSEWHRVAEKYGFIVLYPTALYGQINIENKCIDPNFAPLSAWNIFEEDDRPDELRFFHYLLERMRTEYPVDSTRVYATGHSWGSQMTQMLALAMPERFAAVAPCSGVFIGGAEKTMLASGYARNRRDIAIPVWMFCGEKEAFLIDAVPSGDNATGFTIAMWLKKSGMESRIPKNWEDCSPVVHGRWNDYFFDADEKPMVRFTSVSNMPHATMPEMSFRIWEEFFSKVARLENGELAFLK